MSSEENTDTQALLAGRESVYGNRVDNMERVARMWNGYLGTDIITPADMMMMMALYKACRFKVTPDYADNINDVLGYAQIVKDVQAKAGGLIEAETAKEYQAKKRMIDLTPEERITRNLAGDHEPISQDPDPLGHGPDQSEGRMLEQWLRHRCGADYAGDGILCMLASGHSGAHQANGHRHPYEVADEQDD